MTDELREWIAEAKTNAGVMPLHDWYWHYGRHLVAKVEELAGALDDIQGEAAKEPTSRACANIWGIAEFALSRAPGGGSE